MFFTYLGRELRRRARQAIFIALGLAVGIGLVITVTAASNGVKNSQAAVLHSLYGVGTDITVTQPPAANSSPGTRFGFGQRVRAFRPGAVGRAGGPGEQPVTPGAKINVNNLTSVQYGTLASSSVARAAAVHNVSAAVGGLTLSDVTVTGKVPAIKPGTSPGFIRSNFKTGSFTVAGVDVSNTHLGALSSAKVTSGTTLTAADANSSDAVVDSNYAKQNKLKVNSTISVGGKNFKIIGIASAPQATSPPNVYIPLSKAQSIGNALGSSLTGKVNTIYIAASSASDIPAVQSSLAKMFPKATITDEDNLASQVTGSLSSASSLANNLGKWLSVAVLIAAFLLASLLTMSAVSRRVREFGTLKALGWRSRRVIGQVIGESIAIGIIGGVVGVGLGFGGAALIDNLAKKLTATVGSNSSPGGFGPAVAAGPGGPLRSLFNNAHTVSVPLTATVTVSAIVLAVVLAIAGGLIAGGFGGWRAARLRPAAALAKVE